MKQQQGQKGPKFDAMPVNASASPQSGFSIDIPEKVRALIMNEQRIANSAIETYAKERIEQLRRIETQILRVFVALQENVPPGLDLRPNDDFTKLIQ